MLMPALPRWGNSGNSGWLFFWVPKVTADGDCCHEIKRHLLLGRKVMTNLDRILKSRDITLPRKVHLVKAMLFSVVTYGCESWTTKKAECRKNWCFWTVVLENTLESPLDCKETQPVHPKGDQSWVFTGRTDVEAETPILWPKFLYFSWLPNKLAIWFLRFSTKNYNNWEQWGKDQVADTTTRRKGNAIIKILLVIHTIKWLLRLTIITHIQAFYVPLFFLKVCFLCLD